jgi:WD40 repeat protein
VWDIEHNSVVPLARSSYVHDVAVTSPDGSVIAGGVEDRAVRVWDLRTGAERVTLRGHRDLVSGIAFSPDGKHLATSSYDRTVRVWNVATGDGQVLSGHVGPVWAVAWVRPDQVVSGSSDGTVRLWTLPDRPAPDAQEIRARLASETSAVIDDRNRPATLIPAPPVPPLPPAPPI